MKKFLLTSLAGILAVSTANAFDVAPYASIKGGYSVTNIAAKGDSINLHPDLEESFGSYHAIADVLDIRVHTDGVWSVNPAVGAKVAFDDVNFATFRVEAEFAYNQDAKKSINLSTEWHKDTYSVKMQTWGIMANAYMDFQTNSFIKPFISAGLGYGNSKLSYNYSGYDIDSGGAYDAASWKKNNLIWSVGGGLSFDITENIAVDAQYRYTDYGNVKLTISDGYDELGSIEVKDVMHQFMLGARYTF